MSFNFDNLADGASERDTSDSSPTPPSRTDEMRNLVASFFGGATVDLHNCTFLETSGDLTAINTSEGPQFFPATEETHPNVIRRARPGAHSIPDFSGQGGPSFFKNAKNVTVLGGQFSQTVVDGDRYTTTTAIVLPAQPSRALRTESRVASGTSIPSALQAEHRDHLSSVTGDSGSHNDGTTTCIVSQDDNCCSILWVPT